MRGEQPFAPSPHRRWRSPPGGLSSVRWRRSSGRLAQKFSTTLLSRGCDRLITRERTPSGAVITSAVECKYYTRPISVEVISQFASTALLLKHQSLIDRAIIVALSGFTLSAQERARAHNIDILEFDDLKQRLSDVNPLALEEARKAVETDEIAAGESRWPRAFVVMPFSAEFQDVYILGIREVAEKLGFVVERADSIEHNEFHTPNYTRENQRLRCDNCRYYRSKSQCVLRNWICPCPE